MKKKQKINESFLRMFGGLVKRVLKGMFGEQTPLKEEAQENLNPPVNIRGTEKEINSFVKALVGEKQYIERMQRVIDKMN